MDIRKLAINNSWKVVKTFKKILLDQLTRLDTFNNAILYLPGPGVSNNAVQDFFRPDSSSSTPKSLLGNNARLNNSQKKKTT